jgi:hypothetical protein
MDVEIIICLLIILITYLAIAGLLGYYYIKHRVIWYAMFDMSLFYGLEESSKLEGEIYLEQVKILSSIYKLFKQLDENNFIMGCNYFNQTFKMLKWFLEGSITNYENIKNEQSIVYYQLKDVYNTQNNISIDSHELIDDILPNLQIEQIDIYENNIILIRNIIQEIENNLSSITKFHSHYLIALFNDILFYCNAVLYYNSLANV